MDGWDLRGIVIGIAWDVNPFFIIRKYRTVALINVKIVPLNVGENKSAVTCDAGVA